MRLLLLGLAGIGTWLFVTKTKTGQAILTKERAAIHGHLMGYEINPQKLEKASYLFAREGLTDQARQLTDKARTIEAQMYESIKLAERARAGDQNAMAMIAACRDQARSGNKRAFVTCVCIEWYCKNHPVPERVGEPPIPPAVEPAPVPA